MTSDERVSYNARLLEIWHRASSEFHDYTGENGTELPLLSPCLVPINYVRNQCKLLIIGQNPSYSYSNWRQVIGLQSDDQVDNIFKFENLSIYQQEIIDNDANALDKVPYFTKMKELNEHIFHEDNAWLHVDLYFYRKTSKNKLINLIKSNIPFFNEQLDLTKDIITSIKPQIILVANAYSGEIFRKMFYSSGKINNEALIAMDKDELYNNFYKKYFKEETGTYDIKISENNVQVFFSGMLSGQHSLDLGSFERLKWHMKAIVENKRMS